MKKRFLPLLLSAVLLLALSGCGEDTLLEKNDPVTVDFWHVYGEQSGSPMDALVQEFNSTIGQDTGVRVRVSNLSSAAEIGGFLKEAQNGGDLLNMPDLFTCHLADAVALGEENLVDWRDWFTEEELSDFVPGFLEDGMGADGRLLLFPISKSTQLFMCNGTGFDRFSKACGVKYEDLATWDGFYDAAARFHDWSGGRTFCALDYPIRAVELRAMECGSGDFYTENGWYDPNNAVFKESWMQFARALAQGHVVVSDLYSNTQVMTGETLAGLGSSAAILYYNDVVTYPDNTTEPTDLLLAPLPHAAGTATPLMPQAGVGLCAFKTTDRKAEAAAVFLRWLTEQQRNLEFAADTGYMPVSSAAFDAIADYPFEQQSYQRLYDVYNAMRIQNTPVSEPGIVGYHAKAKALYDSLRQRQKDYPQRLADGETLEALTAETWQLLCDNA